MCALLRKGQDITLLHPVRQVGADEGLVARQDTKGNSAAAQLSLQVPGGLAYLGGVRLVLVLDPVWRADHGADAGYCGEARHRNAGRHVRRAVIQPRQDMTCLSYTHLTLPTIYSV